MTAQLVLFACTHNAGRSQIANAFFNLLADPAKARSIAAGLDPIERVHDEVVQVMRKVGLALSGVQPVTLTGRMLTDLDFLVTLGCPSDARRSRSRGGRTGACGILGDARSTRSG